MCIKKLHFLLGVSLLILAPHRFFSLNHSSAQTAVWQKRQLMMLFSIIALYRRLFIFLSPQIGLKNLMIPVSCPEHTQNRVDIFLLCRMRMTKPCSIRFSAKIVDLKVHINE
jgi:hypothetical protein